MASNVHPPQRQLARRDAGQNDPGPPVRPVDDKNVAAAPMETVEVDIPETDSPPAQVVPDGGSGLPLSDLGVWLALGLALLLLPLFFLVRRRRKKREEAQRGYA